MKKRTLLGLILLLIALALFGAAAESDMAKEYADQIDKLFDQYGNFQHWSAEQRAELSAIEEKAGCRRDGSPIKEIYRTPDAAKGEKDEEAARTLAQEALAKEDVAASRYPIAYAGFYAPAEKPDETMWEVQFEAPVGLNDYTVYLSAKGELIKTEKSETANLFDREGRFITAALQNSDNIVPSATDIHARRAAEIAVKVYNETMGTTAKAEEMSVTGGLKALNGRHFWLIGLFDGSLPPEGNSDFLFDVVLDAKTGQVIHSVNQDAYLWRSEPYRRGLKLKDKLEKDGCFLTWSLEEQKAAWPDLLALPEDGELSKDEARTVAKETLQREAGLSDRFFDRYQAYYMLENNDHASKGKAWHVVFALPEDLPNGSLVPTNIYGFNVWVDAASGRMLSFSVPKERAFCSHFYQYDDGTGTTNEPASPAEVIARGLPCPVTGLSLTAEAVRTLAREALQKSFPRLRVQDYCIASFTHVLQHMQEYFVVKWEKPNAATLIVVLSNDGAVAAHTKPERYDDAYSSESEGEVIHWALSVKDKAAYMPDIYGLPKAGDLTEEEALKIAVQALKTHYALTDREIEQLVPTLGINLFTTRRWEVNFFPKEQVEKNTYSESYYVDIDIVTGDLLCYYSPSECNG